MKGLILAGGALGHGDLAAALAVDLHRHDDGRIDKQCRVDLGPGRIGDHAVAGAAQRFPAGFGQVRHHRGDQLHQPLGALANHGVMRGRAERRARRLGVGPFAQGVGQLVDLRHGAIEAQRLDVLADARHRAVDELAQLGEPLVGT